LILGVAYRGGVKETAYSGAFALRDALLGLGASPVADDPLYEAAELRRAGFEPWDGGHVDAIIVQADHQEYKDLLPSNFPGVRVVYDGRAILEREKWEVGGLSMKVIGRG
jgi:UDP-N-acetyl-D-mannosaminuronic acid dehydrogenase